MPSLQEIVIVSAMHTAVGDFGGALKSVPPTELASITAKEALSRAQISGDAVDQSFYGHVIHTEPKDMYLSRVAAMNAGVRQEAPALTVNRLCSSGLQAVISAIQALALGEGEIMLAGGAESMSRSGSLIPSARWGQRMGDATIIDMMTMVLTDPFGHGHMGITAENLSDKYDISREAQDAFALESHRRAAAAIEAGYFKDQIVPVTLKSRKGETIFDTDEHVRTGLAIEDLQKLRPAFKKDGTVTAGNASGINDGAASLVLMTEAAAKARGLSPLARVLSYGHAGVAPEIMGIGPVPAMQIALERAGLTLADLDIIESNEAFAAQACAVSKALDLDPEKVNPNGGAIALGHPIGASGAIITVKLLHELIRRDARYGAATLCVGGGQGLSLIVEKI